VEFGTRETEQIAVLPVPTSSDNEAGIRCEMGTNFAGDDISVEERVHVSTVGPSEFLKTMAMLLEIRRVGMKA
jgi:hypothetical protein